MKKTIILFFIFLSFSIYSQNRQRLNVLFLGNSYTENNNLPETITNIAASVGDTLIHDKNTPMGATFKQHCTNESAVKIALGNWDYVVLQEQSQYPAFPLWQVETECFPYAKALVDSVHKHNPNGRPVFYMTWGHRNGDPFNCPIYPPICTYEGMDNLLYERYMMMANDNDATMSPVGKIWRYLRTYYPFINLYQEDGTHPSEMGTYAAACTFYTILFQKDPTLIKTSFDLNPSQAQIIRNLIKVVVYDSLEQWKVVINPQNKAVITDTVSAITQTKALLHAQLNTDSSKIKEVGFEYKLINDSVFSRKTTSLMIDFEDTIHHLLPNEQYVYRAYCLTHNESAVYGMKKYFNTLPITLLINNLTNITNTTCDVEGSYQYDDNKVLTVGFEWKKDKESTAYYKDTQLIEKQFYSLNISNLNPSTTYIIRAYAICNDDTTFSASKTFTTLKNANDSSSVALVNELNTLLIYPNPTQDIINIALTQAINATLLLYNIDGQIMISKTINGTKISIDISALSNGLYYLKIINRDNYPIIHKVIKQ